MGPCRRGDMWRHGGETERCQGMPLHAPGEDEVQVKKIGVSFVFFCLALALAPPAALAPTPLSLQPRYRSRGCSTTRALSNSISKRKR